MPSRPKLIGIARTHASLIVLLLIFVLLGILYNISLPLFEAPDEMAHFRYVNWLATGHSLPNIDTDLHAVGHEVGQPPLYYSLLAPLVASVNMDDLYQIAPANPYRGGAIAMNYHTSAERFPYRNTALAVHLARLASTLIAVVTITSTYGIARIAAPKQAVLAAALVAFNPQFLFISASVNNDNLVTALVALALLLLVWQIVPPRVPWWLYFLTGALWGLATVAKMSGLALGGIILMGLSLAAWRHRSWRPFALGIPVVLGGAAITAGWWFARNWMLYGDPFAWQEMLTANKALLRPELLSWPDTLHYATYLHRSFWAMFGYGIPASTRFYQIINVMTFVALVGVALWLAGNLWRRPTQARTLAVLLQVAWCLIVFVSLLRWMRQVSASNQGRLYFPAISSLAVLLALGLSMFSRRRNWLGLGMTVFLLVWAIASPFLFIQPAYAQPKLLPAKTEFPNPVSIQFGEEMRLVGYELPQPTVQPRAALGIELYWQGLTPMSESYVVALHALDSTGQVVAGLDTIPYEARYPTPLWLPGQPFRDSYGLLIEAQAMPGQAKLLLDVYPAQRPDDALPAEIDGTPVDVLVLTTFKIALQEMVEYSPTNDADATFGQQARLLGYDSPEAAEVGQPHTVTLYWEALEPDGNDYTVFVHLLDGSGQLAAQADSPPQENGYPTSIWDSGEQILDPHTLALPDDLAPGRYRLVVGLYSPITGQRLPALRGDGTHWSDDSVLLGSIEVIRGP